MSEGNGYVKWPAFIGTLLTVAALIIGVVSGIGSYALAQHASHPHEGTVSEKEFDLMLSRLDRMEKKIDTLIERGK